MKRLIVLLGLLLLTANCKATIGKGLPADHPTDLVGDDCVTDINDFAEIAKKWLTDSKLEGSVAKP